MPRVSEDMRALVEAQTKANVEYYKAKASLAQAHQKMVLQGLNDGILDISELPLYR